MPKESITEPLACSLLVFLSYSGLSKFLMFTLHKIGDATNDYFYCQLICQIFSWLIVCRKIEQKWPYQFPKSAAQGDVFKFLFRLISLKPKNIPFIITRQEKEDILTILIYELDIRNLVEKYPFVDYFWMWSLQGIYTSPFNLTNAMCNLRCSE